MQDVVSNHWIHQLNKTQHRQVVCVMIGVWCAMSAARVIGSIFSSDFFMDIVRPFLFTYPISRQRKPVICKTAHQLMQHFYAHCREYLWWQNNKLAAKPCDFYPRTADGLNVYSAYHVLNFSNSLRCALKDVLSRCGSSKPKNTTSSTSLTYGG